jgi:guanyl-specific ribonuclease Sa
MTARLDAVRAGSAAYFTKPVDNDDLLGVLRELLLPQTSQDYYRVLIVNDRPTEAWEMAGSVRGARHHAPGGDPAAAGAYRTFTASGRICC